MLASLTTLESRDKVILSRVMYGNVIELDNYSQVFLIGAPVKYFHFPTIPEYQTTTLLFQ